jgi:hypothetical protein
VAARRPLATAGAALAAFLTASAARAQTDTQLWANITFDWIESRRFTIGVDTEPKVLLAAPPGDPDRFESLWPINRRRLTDDDAAYLTGDWEWFIPLDDPDERFANRQRIRAGLGDRRSFAWRVEAMYVWNRSRNTLSDPYTTSDQAIDLTVKRVW